MSVLQLTFDLMCYQEYAIDRKFFIELQIANQNIDCDAVIFPSDKALGRIAMTVYDHCSAPELSNIQPITSRIIDYRISSMARVYPGKKWFQVWNKQIEKIFIYAQILRPMEGIHQTKAFLLTMEPGYTIPGNIHDTLLLQNRSRHSCKTLKASKYFRT